MNSVCRNRNPGSVRPPLRTPCNDIREVLEPPALYEERVQELETPAHEATLAHALQEYQRSSEVARALRTACAGTETPAALGPPCARPAIVSEKFWSRPRTTNSVCRNWKPRQHQVPLPYTLHPAQMFGTAQGYTLSDPPDHSVNLIVHRQ